MGGSTSDIEQLKEENECGSDEEWTPKAVHTVLQKVQTVVMKI